MTSRNHVTYIVVIINSIFVNKILLNIFLGCFLFHSYKYVYNVITFKADMNS